MLNKKKRVAITIAMILIGFSIVLMIVAVILNIFDSSGGNDGPSNNTLENNIIVNDSEKIKEEHCLDFFCITSMEMGYQKNVEGGDITISYRNQGDDVLPAGFLHIEFETKKGSKTLIFYHQELKAGESSNKLLDYLDEDIVYATDYRLLQPTEEQIKEYEKTISS